MRGFDDHLDNYGNPGIYPDQEYVKPESLSVYGREGSGFWNRLYVRHLIFERGWTAQVECDACYWYEMARYMIRVQTKVHECAELNCADPRG